MVSASVSASVMLRCRQRHQALLSKIVSPQKKKNELPIGSQGTGTSRACSGADWSEGQADLRQKLREAAGSKTQTKDGTRQCEALVDGDSARHTVARAHHRGSGARNRAKQHPDLDHLQWRQQHPDQTVLRASVNHASHPTTTEIPSSRTLHTKLASGLPIRPTFVSNSSTTTHQIAQPSVQEMIELSWISLGRVHRLRK